MIFNKSARIKILTLIILVSHLEIIHAQLFNNQYEEIKQVNSDTYIVKSDSLWGIVDKSNSVKLPIIHQSIGLNDKVFSIIFRNRNGKYGITDVLAMKNSETIYDSITILKSSGRKSYLRCWKDGITSIYEEHKGILFTQNCIDIQEVFENKNVFMIKGNKNKWGLINKENKIQIPVIYDTLILHQNKSIDYRVPQNRNYFFSGSLEGKYGLIDFDNHSLVEFKFDDIQVVHQNHFIIKKLNQYGSIDSTGKIIIPIEYPLVELFYISDGSGPKIKVLNNRNFSGMYNKDGKLIIKEEYQYDKFVASCNTFQNNLGYCIEGNKAESTYFFYMWNDYKPIEFSSKEKVGNLESSCIYVYTTPDNKKYIVGGDPKKLCSNSFEYFDEYEKIIKEGKEFIVLRRIDKQGNIKFGVRETWFGKCIASIQFDHMDFSINEKHIEYFKPGKNEILLAIGKINADKSQWILSNYGAKQIK
jgi:hypothetical protein